MADDQKPDPFGKEDSSAKVEGTGVGSGQGGSDASDGKVKSAPSFSRSRSYEQSDRKYQQAKREGLDDFEHDHLDHERMATRDREVLEAIEMQKRPEKKKKKAPSLYKLGKTPDIIVPAIRPPEKKFKFKITKKRLRNFAILAVFGLFLKWGFTPISGTPIYGVCRTLISMDLLYPSTMQVHEVALFDTAAIILFSNIDGFGSSELRQAECDFEVDSNGQLKLANMTYDRKPISREKLEASNKILPILFANPGDLVLPVSRGSDLASLKLDFI
jgi:hypothetical protein